MLWRRPTQSVWALVSTVGWSIAAVYLLITHNMLGVPSMVGKDGIPIGELETLWWRILSVCGMVTLFLGGTAFLIGIFQEGRTRSHRDPEAPQT